LKAVVVVDLCLLMPKMLKMKGDVSKENAGRRVRNYPVANNGRSRKAVKTLFENGHDQTAALQECAQRVVDGVCREMVVWNNNFDWPVAGLNNDVQSSAHSRRSPNGKSPSEYFNNRQFKASTPVKSPSSSPMRNKSFESPKSSRSLSRSPPTPVYAGAKFSEAPSPKVLPKPPIHWVETTATFAPPSSCRVGGTCREMTDALKGLLKVQC
jgi:hypothetical protein